MSALLPPRPGQYSLGMMIQYLNLTLIVLKLHRQARLLLEEIRSNVGRLFLVSHEHSI